MGEGLAVSGLSKVYEASHGRKLVANDQLDLEAARGGRSPSSASPAAASPPSPHRCGARDADAGRISFGGKLLAEAGKRGRDTAAQRTVQMVFQNPDGTLNPSHSVGWPIRRVLAKFGLVQVSGRNRARTRELLETVQLPVELASRRPSPALRRAEAARRHRARLRRQPGTHRGG